jgi:hypothetical protein
VAGEALEPDVDTKISCAVRPDSGGYGWTSAKRNARLAECNWTQVADAPLTAKQRAAWKEYRQALRNLPAAVGWPARP